MRLIASIDNSTSNFPISEALVVAEYIKSTIDMNLKDCVLILDDDFTNELDIAFTTPDVNSKCRYLYIEIAISTDNAIEDVCDYLVKKAKAFNTLEGFKIDRYKYEKHNRRCSFYFNDQSVIPERLLEEIHNAVTIITV